MRAKMPALRPVKMIQVGKNLVGSNTERWYESRMIWTGAGQVAYGVSQGDYYTVILGLIQIILRIYTKKEINLFKR